MNTLRPYGQPPTGTRDGAISTTREGGGYVTTCDCLWLRFWPTHNDAADGRREHAKKCKGPAIKAEPAAKASPAKRTSWDDREGATWIDKL